MTKQEIAADLRKNLKGSSFARYSVRSDVDKATVDVVREGLDRNGRVVSRASVSVTEESYVGAQSVQSGLEAQAKEASKRTQAAIRAERARS